MKPKVKCPHCHESISESGLKKHQKNKPCVAKQNANRARKLGLVKVPWDTQDLVELLKVPSEEMTTEYYKRAYRHSSSYGGTFVSREIGTVLSLCAYSSSVEEEDRLSYQECAAVVHLMMTDPDTADAIQATIVAAGVEAKKDRDNAIFSMVKSIGQQALLEGVSTPADEDAKRRDTSWAKARKNHLESMAAIEASAREREERERIEAIERKAAEELSALVEREELEMDSESSWRLEP